MNRIDVEMELIRMERAKPVCNCEPRGSFHGIAHAATCPVSQRRMERGLPWPSAPWRTTDNDPED